jgi:hypothetical protein
MTDIIPRIYARLHRRVAGILSAAMTYAAGKPRNRIQRLVESGKSTHLPFKTKQKMVLQQFLLFASMTPSSTLDIMSLDKPGRTYNALCVLLI